VPHIAVHDDELVPIDTGDAVQPTTDDESEGGSDD
jgi:hypothetical protein